MGEAAELAVVKKKFVEIQLLLGARSNPPSKFLFYLLKMVTQNIHLGEEFLSNDRAQMNKHSSLRVIVGSTSGG